MDLTIEDSRVPSAFEEAHEIVKGLIRDFQAKEAYYLKPDYQEAETRKDFIDKFFIALGWDVNHDVQKNPYEQEVKVEPSVEVEGRNKRADYSFSIAPNFRDPRFYAEAKKPSSDLLSPQSYFQTIRYAWNRSTPIAVLTNFYQFHVVDCRYKPNIDNAVDRGLKELQFFYTDLLKEDSFRKVYHLFSKSSVEAGALEKFAEGIPRKRGKEVQKGLFKIGFQKIDDSFLEELDEYRLILAKAFKRNNSQLADYALTEAVQRTIDRLVFIRFLEDKLIEEKDYISKFGDNNSAWTDFVKTCRKLDPKYNGLIFHEHFIDETDFNAPDEEEFSDICFKISHDKSPYDFNAIPIDILGSIYERFLGKIITSKGKTVEVVQKPEVKKAGGVYYTPQNIVKYIINKTVGIQIEDKDPDEIEKMNFIDIACGSGSFLLGLYDLLIIYHSKYYTDHPRKGLKNEEYELVEGHARLTIKKKQKILLNNIYGVDIDQQAVEVTQMSLYLRLLEDETLASVGQMKLIKNEAILPSMGDNIKCGNSIIEPDILEGDLFPGEEERKLNPMYFRESFEKVFAEGGFDAVIGNPPYIGFHGFKKEKPYIIKKYQTAIGKFDIYLPFIEKGLSVLKPKGLLGFICPTNFMKRDHGARLRSLLKRNVKIKFICDFEDVQIFKGALNYTGIYVFENTPPNGKDKFLLKRRSLDDPGTEFQQTALEDGIWVFRDAESSIIVEKILKNQTSPLDEITIGIMEGIVTGLNKIFLLPSAEAKALKLEKDFIRPCIRGREIRKYYTDPPAEVIIYPYKLINRKTICLTESELKDNSNLYQYLKSQRNNLKGRDYFENSTKQWFELWNQRDMALFEREKIIVAELSEANRFSVAKPGQYYGDTVCGLSLKSEIKENLYYIIGLLNSELIEYFYKKTTVPKANQFFIYKTMFLKNIPIRRINFENQKEADNHNEIVTLVGQIMKANENLHKAQTDKDKSYFSRIIKECEAKIDRIVYELYNIDPLNIITIKNSDQIKGLEK